MDFSASICEILAPLGAAKPKKCSARKMSH